MKKQGDFSPDLKWVWVVLDTTRRQHQQYWAEHPDRWEQQQERECSLCGRMKDGYPFIWWQFSAPEHFHALKGIGAIPNLACPDCYGHYCVQREVWGKTEEEALLELLKDRNWRVWLSHLEQCGFQSFPAVGGNETHWAFVVQLYANADWIQDDQPAIRFHSAPLYMVSIPDALSDPFEFEGVNVARVIGGYDYAEVVRGTEELREYLRVGPEVWHAQRDGLSVYS